MLMRGHQPPGIEEISDLTNEASASTAKGHIDANSWIIIKGTNPFKKKPIEQQDQIWQ